MDTNALNGLKTVHLPTAVSVFPLAPGWYIVLAIILFAIIFAILWLRHKQMRQQARGEVYILFDELEANHQLNANPELLSELTILMKRVAMMRYPEASAHTLYGKDWLHFLDKTGKTNTFSQGAGRVLLNVYQPQQVDDTHELFMVIRQWLRTVL